MTSEDEKWQTIYNGSREILQNFQDVAGGVSGKIGEWERLQSSEATKVAENLQEALEYMNQYKDGRKLKISEMSNKEVKRLFYDEEEAREIINDMIEQTEAIIKVFEEKKGKLKKIESKMEEVEAEIQELPD